MLRTRPERARPVKISDSNYGPTLLCAYSRYLCNSWCPRLLQLAHPQHVHAPGLLATHRLDHEDPPLRLAIRLFIRLAIRDRFPFDSILDRHMARSPAPRSPTRCRVRRFRPSHGVGCGKPKKHHERRRNCSFTSRLDEGQANDGIMDSRTVHFNFQFQFSISMFHFDCNLI